MATATSTVMSAGPPLASVPVTPNSSRPRHLTGARVQASTKRARVSLPGRTSLVSRTPRLDSRPMIPLGASTNDYDLFVVNAAGTAVLCASTTVQNGLVDPLEACYSTSRPVGSRIMVAQKAGAAQRVQQGGFSY